MLITYALLDTMAMEWVRALNKPITECTCLSCIDATFAKNTDTVICDYVLDFYNFDGDCLACK